MNVAAVNCTTSRCSERSRRALANVSFDVQRGHTIAFVGPSGAGKTTLVKLLVGLYRSSHGRILYNGAPTERVDLDRFRERIGLVTQDAHLFSGTIRENLLLPRPDATDEQCLSVLRQGAPSLEDVPLARR